MHGLQFIEYTYYNRFGLKYIEKNKKKIKHLCERKI